MPTFSQIAKGTRARRRVSLPLGDAPLLRPEVTPDGTVRFAASDDAVAVDVRVLSSSELSDVLAAARRDAIARGVADPRDGNPIYDLAEMEHTVAVSCLDVDSPGDAPRPFFDGGVEQLRASAEMGRDRIAYLYEQQQLLQDEASPTLRTMGPAELMAVIEGLGDEQNGNFTYSALGQAARLVCTLTMARLLRASPTRKLCSSSASRRRRGTCEARSEHPVSDQAGAPRAPGSHRRPPAARLRADVAATAPH